MMNIGVEPKSVRDGNFVERGLSGIRLKRYDEPDSEDDFYQDDEPLQKPARMLTVVDGQNTPLSTNADGLKPHVEQGEDAALTVLTVKGPISPHKNGPLPYDENTQGVSPIGEYREQTPSTLSTNAVDQPVEQDDLLTAVDNPPSTDVYISGLNGHTEKLTQLPYSAPQPYADGPKTPLEATSLMHQWVDTPRGYGQVVHVTADWVEVDVMGKTVPLRGDEISQIKVRKTERGLYK
jgi:hypothetical protein